MTTTNSLLRTNRLPTFSQIKVSDIEPAIDFILAENRKQLAALLSENKEYTWANLLQPLEQMEDRLNRTWSPINHLHAVADNPDLREAYNNCLAKLTDYATELGQNKGLYQAFKQIAEGNEYADLNYAQQKFINNSLRDFRLSGIELLPEKQKQYREIQQKLSKLQTQFEENLLDATQGWTKHITKKENLNGLPDSALALVAQNAKRANKPGWVLTLEFPCYFPVMQYVEDRSLRQEMYEAYVTRASDLGSNAGKWDNSTVMVEILSLRNDLARLLGFNCYAEYSLSRKMAKSPDEVLDFLNGLGKRSRSVAYKEFTELQTFAQKHFNIGDLQAWDIAFFSEKLRQHKFDFSQEELRSYFPVPRVLDGMFSVVQQLYDISIKEQKQVDTWHADVCFYNIYSSDDELLGSFYLDLYARAHKRSGAWMDECIVRRKYKTEIQKPVAYLTCNFTPPTDNTPSLLTHDEVITLFHEFGHGLHHMLTRIDIAGVSGINGVPWDAVELPSQLMENWCWESESLDIMTGHYQTDAPLPDTLFKKLFNTKQFQAGMQMIRQLEFALFDFHLHYDYQVENCEAIQALLDDIRAKIAVVTPPSYNRFQHSFSHIFAGGYAAGYYSYKWAEVLSADAFSKFQEKGIFDKVTGQQFKQTILEQGGARDPMELFVEFRGRKPSIEPLLQQTGIINQPVGEQA